MTDVVILGLTGKCEYVHCTADTTQTRRVDLR